MTEAPKHKDEEKGDEILRRLLKTPPDPKTGKGEKPKKGTDDGFDSPPEDRH